jgi:hypothetical protein
VAVAVAYVVVATAGGGYSPQFRAGATLVVWWAVVVGLVFGLWPRARVPARALVAGAGLLALTVLSGLSIGWAADDGGAFTETVRAAGYLGVFTLVVLASPAGSARSWLGGLAIGLVAVSALALGSRIEPSAFPEQDLSRLLPSVATRLSYPLNYWNGLGACMAAGIVLLVWLGAHARARPARAFAVAAVPLPALALFLTSSRGAFVALAVGLVVLLAVTPERARMLAGGLLGGLGAAVVIAMADAREAFLDGRVEQAGASGEAYEMLAAVLVVGAAAGALRLALDGPLMRLAVPRPAALAALALAVVAGAVGLAAADPGARIDDFKEPPAEPGPARGFVTRHLASAEGSGRYQFWETALDAFETEPLRGIGAGGYEAWWAQNGSLAYYIRDAHSMVAEVLAELGVLGLIALLTFVGGAAAAGLAARAADARAGPAAVGGAIALLACGATSLSIDWTWELPAAFVLVVVAAGVLAGPALGEAAPSAGSRFGLGILTLAAGWIAVIAAAIALVTEVKLADSRAAARERDYATAASDAAAARAVQPWAGGPRLQVALVRERRGDLAGARRAALEAAERDGDDWRVWLVVARIELRAGDVPAARRAARRARALNPRSPVFAQRVP